MATKMVNIWSGKVLKNCRNCGAKIGDVFYDRRMTACEGFAMGQFSETCFNKSKMPGRAEGVRYRKNKAVQYESD
ncbi:Uncharacterised protein [uncultured archaeon]|nr:Uncharacterised protein [uncultured archaeon]